MKDFYYILGTHSNSTPGEIGEAYRKLSQKLDPVDEGDYFLQSHFREISEAYEILSDPTRRSLYDAAYKRDHRKQLANFKTRYLNIALTCSLIVFTTLFGIYVFRLINNNNNATKIIIPPAVVQNNPATPYKVKHHKRRIHNHALETAAKKPTVFKKDTAKVIVAKTTPATGTAAPVKTTTPANQTAPINKTASAAKITPAQPAVNQPTLAANNQVNAVVDSSYTTYLKPNLTGSVYLHQLADYMSSVVTVLPSHSKIKVLEKGRSFYKVAFNNQVGYIPKSTITTP